jgi:pimeloyl-ACP methyl ester carboxylesterase
VEEHATSILKLQYPDAWLLSNHEGTHATNQQYMISVIAEDMKWGCPSKTPPMVGLLGQLTAITRHFVSNARLKLLKNTLAAQGTPILIIVGSEDSLVRTTNSEMLRDILECPLTKIDTSGHMIHIQLPHLFNSTLQSHFVKAPKELPIKNAASTIPPITPIPLAKL